MKATVPKNLSWVHVLVLLDHVAWKQHDITAARTKLF
jgi:hypothetical protein